MSDPVPPPPSGTGAPADAGSEAAQIYGFAGTVTAFTLLSRVLGMVRDLVIAHRFGATGATDAWVQAFRIPNALRRLTAEGSVTIAFIPTYVRVRTEQGPEAARAFAQRVLGLVLAVTLLLCGLGIVFADFLTALFSPGFRGEPVKFGLASSLLAGTFPYLVLISLVAWAMGVLNSEGRFAAPAAAPIFLNVGIIVAVLGFAERLPVPILSIAGGVVAGGVVQVALQVPSLLAVGVRPVPRGGWADPALRRLFRLLVPSLFGVAVYELNIIVLGIIASFLPSGQIFHYNNATRLTELVMGLFAFAFTTAGLPTLSEHVARENWPRLRETLRLTFAATQYTILPAMVGLAVAGEGIVGMLYLHGAFTHADVRSTADTLAVLALGMPAVAAVRVMVPTFYAFGDARRPVVAAALTLAVTAALGWWLSQRYLVLGLAGGLTLGTWFQCLVLAGWLRGKTAHVGPWFPTGALARQAGTALAMGLAVRVLHGFGAWAHGPFAPLNWAVLAAVVLGGAGLYFVLTLGLREPQAQHWLALLQRVAARGGGGGGGA